MKKISHKIIYYLFISLFFPVLTATAALIYQYPKINGVTISSETSLGGAIKYYVAWAIILGAVIAFVSLIKSGISYMVSAGQPANQKKAIDGVTNAFIGLFILLASYLILETINPQITVMRVKKQAVKTGAIFLSSNYYTGHRNACNNPIDERSLSKLLDTREATYLGYSTGDAMETFGGEKFILKGTNSGGKNFCEFQKSSPSCLYFFDNNIRIYAYPKKDFKGTPVLYEHPESGRTIDITGDIKNECKFESKITYEKPDGSEASGKCCHPPQSIKVEVLYPGVYLYSDKLGDDRFIGVNKPRLDGLLFDDKTEAVEIRNHKKNSTSDDYDYLAALYKDNNYGGKFRLVFAKKERVINTDGTKKITSGNALVKLGSGSPHVYISNVVEELQGKTVAWLKDPNTGDVVYDDWGGVFGVSSVKSFRLSNNDPTTCKEVMFCTEPNFKGECIDYYLDGTTPTVENNFRYLATRTMDSSLYQVADLLDESHKITTTLASTPPQTKESYFAENISSIKIRGKCLVALFQRKKDEIKTKGTGNHSRLFTSSISDLSGYQSNTCGEIRIIGRLREGHSCSKSFAIFPLER